MVMDTHFLKNKVLSVVSTAMIAFALLISFDSEALAADSYAIFLSIQILMNSTSPKHESSIEGKPNDCRVNELSFLIGLIPHQNALSSTDTSSTKMSRK